MSVISKFAVGVNVPIPTPDTSIIKLAFPDMSMLDVPAAITSAVAPVLLPTVIVLAAAPVPTLMA